MLFIVRGLRRFTATVLFPMPSHAKNQMCLLTETSRFPLSEASCQGGLCIRSRNADRSDSLPFECDLGMVLFS